MKRRIRKVVNFFAFNLLFFALYLNFIHKDKPSVAVIPAAVQTANTASLNSTILVTNPEKYLDPKNTTSTTSVQQSNSVNKAEQNAALKLSIN
ncbi:MAG: hypothetical protein JWM28_3065 [Chitinophagaceae bacterium]|nr:hypothetical protein [Chitinophagaceae bacterium]